MYLIVAGSTLLIGRNADANALIQQWATASSILAEALLFLQEFTAKASLQRQQ